MIRAALLLLQLTTGLPPFGVGTSETADTLCFGIPGAALTVGSRVTLVLVMAEQRVLTATIEQAESNCPHLEKAMVPGRYYQVRVPETIESSGIWIVVAGTPQWDRTGANVVRISLDGRNPDIQFRACTSEEGIHLTAWTGVPLRGRRVWHQYYYLGYDAEPTCEDRDYLE